MCGRHDGEPANEPAGGTEGADSERHVGLSSVQPSAAGISPRWRAVFRVEIPICAATVAYWLIAPDRYVASLFGDAALGVAGRYLVMQGASVVLTMLVWFYGRVLFAPAIDRRTFCYLQEGLLLGDLGVLALSAYAVRAGHPDAATLVAQVAMATLWGAIRVAFLWTHRRRDGSGN